MPARLVTGEAIVALTPFYTWSVRIKLRYPDLQRPGISLPNLIMHRSVVINAALFTVAGTVEESLRLKVTTFP